MFICHSISAAVRYIVFYYLVEEMCDQFRFSGMLIDRHVGDFHSVYTTYMLHMLLLIIVNLVLNQPLVSCIESVSMQISFIHYNFGK